MGNLGNKDAVPKNLDEVDKIGSDQRMYPISSTEKIDTIPDQVDSVPVVFNWQGGGSNVFLAGSFNGWAAKLPMHHSGADFTLIVDLPKNSVQQYKFVVDGKWNYDTNALYQPDAEGNMNNVIDLRKFHPLTLDEAVERSYDDSYNDSEYTTEIPDKDSVIDPPPLPLVFRNIPIGRPVTSYQQRVVPHHSVVNHLYCSIVKESKTISNCLITGVIHRHKQKYVNIIYWSIPKMKK